MPGPLGASPGSATELYHARPKKTLLYKLFHSRREYGGFGFFKVVFLIRNTTVSDQKHNREGLASKEITLRVHGKNKPDFYILLSI